MSFFGHYAPATAPLVSDGADKQLDAVTGKRIIVLGYVINATTAGTFTFEDSAGTDLSSTIELAEKGGASFAGNLDCPAFVLGYGVALHLTATDSGVASGHFTYFYGD